MSLLLSPHALAHRRAAVQGPLAPLADSLRADLQPLLDRGVEIPTAKALLSREGGRCARHGVALEFDPYSPHEHRCPVDGERFRGERHDRWWVMFYHLWLAERAVHAAALHALRGEPQLAALAAEIIDGYAAQYLRYPNRDNVLGPTRPFFSTYLESIWLLQLCVALDLLEMSGAAGTLGASVRDRLVEPSARLIASYDEGGSNRQVWNDAALIAAGTLLDRPDIVHRAIHGSSGLVAHLSVGLLPDGTWYEGENYHFFAHRGLWYAVTMTEQRGESLPAALAARFQLAFAAPLATALPDFTFPSRRDSQYGISLRQWRFAESCELGLARRDDAQLAGALWELYEHAVVPRRDTGRWRSTAEAERNEPASSLTRADLGWRSLLLARPELPPLAPVPARSALLEGQGIAVLRRDAGATYIALDYGHSGGGHGHADRLNLLLVHGADRWLDDVGTGSYVDPTLHWYRSTIAHNAPLIGGRSQQRVSGVLRAFDERGGVGWVGAEVPLGGIAPGVEVRRSVVAMPDYLVDRVEWWSERPVRFELPLHVDADVALVGAHDPAPRADPPSPSAGGAPAFTGGTGLEDGFSFVHDATVVARAPANATVRLGAHARTIAWAAADDDVEWWRAIGPAAPGAPEHERPFLVARMTGTGGTLTTVWSWRAAIASAVLRDDGALVVHLADGTRHEHAAHDDGWTVTLFAGTARSSVALGGARPAPATRAHDADTVQVEPELVPVAPAPPLAYDLGAAAYRISEESWDEAGRPTARVTFRVEERDLVIGVEVHKTPIVFRAPDAPDPGLDNEHPDIHSDGVQLYLAAPAWKLPAAWLAVPELGGDRVRVRLVDGARADLPLDARWGWCEGGYRVRFAVPLEPLGDCRENPVGVQVVVNDMAPTRERRRGQLVLSGGAGEHIYLRGDRESPAVFRHFLLPRV
ncbi:MAG: heparinase II/III family protein [Gemmatimonadaceae bacterium]|nr:heparinase II/III family protein [Gemmatimonadaceae bacterium]